ncbi:replicative DNA helicase [Caballeronia sp. S22]|uniref:replicative DNA helicase n=1 Tax=Caballeronia sp. S22 TaxID=3137182 RepID=UPI0035314FC2
MSANDIQRAIPQAIEAEQSVIGALMLDNDSIDRIGDLRAEHFYRADHRLIFQLVTSMIGEGIGADAITVFERLQAQGKSADVGGLAYLNALVQNTPSSANIARYAGIVRDRAQKRMLLSATSEIQDSVGTTGESADELIDRAATTIEQIGRVAVRREPKAVKQALAEHIHAIDRRLAGTERAISTGLVDLDRQLNGGLRPGWLVILAARPGVGKTSLAMNVANHVAENHSALFLSMEMPESELLDRSIASLGRVPLERVMHVRENDDEFWLGLTAAGQKLSELNLHIDDQPSLRLLDVRSKARLVKRKHGLDVLVVDYLQLMAGEGSNRNSEIEGITRGLKSLAKELGIAIIALAQLNREVEKRAGRMPVLSDLRDSGSIEQDADAVLFIHREEVANPDAGEQWRGFAQVRTAKFRHGRTGDVALTYRGEFVTFENHTGAWPTHTVSKTSRSRGFNE